MTDSDPTTETDPLGRNLVKRLRALAKDYHPATAGHIMIEKAADRIESQDDRIEALEAAIIGLLVAADDINANAFKENWDPTRDLARALITNGDKS